MSEMISTNMGDMPLEDYLDIIAMQYGFEDYQDLLDCGYLIEI